MQLFEPHPRDAETEAVIEVVSSVSGHAPLAIHEAKYLVLAPEQTGRLDITAADVDPEEKSYVGKRTEINFLSASGLPRGRELERPLDTVIAGEDVDVKTSITGTVMIAPKNIGQIILMILHNPKRDTWAMGIVRVLPEYLNASKSRDSKRTLNKLGRQAIYWIAEDEPMPEELRNPLNALPAASAQAILNERSGQAKLNALFSVCLDTPIPRWLVVALGQQIDPAKRVRDSRLRLEPQGVRILSTRYDRAELEALGLNPPESNAFFFSTRRQPSTAVAA
jgi:hypothetical protein